MAVKASDQITITDVTDVKSTCRYYLLQGSTLAKPAKPTTNPPSSWTTTEPSYTAGSTNSLYITDLTVYSDDTFKYSDVSLSSSYEAAKTAYNKAVEAAKTATNYIDYSSSGGLQVGIKASGSWSGFRTQITSAAFNILNATGETLASYGAKLIELGKNAADAVISLCSGKAQMRVWDYELDGEVFELESALPMDIISSPTDSSGRSRLLSLSYDQSEDSSHSANASCTTYASHMNGEGRASAGFRASFDYNDGEAQKGSGATIDVIADKTKSYTIIDSDVISLLGETKINNRDVLSEIDELNKKIEIRFYSSIASLDLKNEEVTKELLYPKIPPYSILETSVWKPSWTSFDFPASVGNFVILKFLRADSGYAYIELFDLNNNKKYLSSYTGATKAWSNWSALN